MSSWTSGLLSLSAVLGVLLAILAGEARALELPGGVAVDESLLDVEKLKASYLPEGLRNTNITVADLKRLLRSKCERANPGGSVDATALSDAIDTAGVKLFECVSGLVNVTEILEEIEVASPKGDLDVVFEKYCLRMPRAKTCLKDFNDALLPCLTREERNHNAVMQRIIEKLLEFICYKNGDQIALFIAEQGPECLQQSHEGIANCLNNTFGGYLPKELAADWTSGSSLPDFILGPKQCVDLYDFETCTVRHLERCETITPSNIVESMFRYVRRESSCQVSIDKVIQERRGRSLALTGTDPAGSGASGLVASGVLLASLGVLFLGRMA
ncbi:hypothetical protein KR018_003787 [Drosophila ironensis]|nr:hypothetical protein KR018_003787 [Drosophila ironensis]